MTVEIMEETRNSETSDVKVVELADIDFDVTSLTTREAQERREHYWDSYIADHGSKPRLAVLTVRAQPAHLGHIDHILSALEADHVAIVIGSAQEGINSPDPHDEKAVQLDIDNPFSAKDREWFIKHLLGKAGKQMGKDLLSKVSFIHSKDVFDDQKWFDDTVTQVTKLNKGPIDVVVANDGWVKRIFDERSVQSKIPTFSVPFLERSPGVRYEGRVERERLRRDGILNPSGSHAIRWPR